MARTRPELTSSGIRILPIGQATRRGVRLSGKETCNPGQRFVTSALGTFQKKIMRRVFRLPNVDLLPRG